LVGLYTDPDPRFPNHHPDPTVTKNLLDLVQAVTAYNADIGLAFDGDGDRIGVVDETGRIIWGDELMVLFARSILAERPGATIIRQRFRRPSFAYHVRTKRNSVLSQKLLKNSLPPTK